MELNNIILSIKLSAVVLLVQSNLIQKATRDQQACDSLTMKTTNQNVLEIIKTNISQKQKKKKLSISHKNT